MISFKCDMCGKDYANDFEKNENTFYNPMLKTFKWVYDRYEVLGEMELETELAFHDMDLCPDCRKAVQLIIGSVIDNFNYGSDWNSTDRNDIGKILSSRVNDALKEQYPDIYKRVDANEILWRNKDTLICNDCGKEYTVKEKRYFKSPLALSQEHGFFSFETLALKTFDFGSDVKKIFLKTGLCPDCYDKYGVEMHNIINPLFEDYQSKVSKEVDMYIKKKYSALFEEKENAENK